MDFYSRVHAAALLQRSTPLPKHRAQFAPAATAKRQQFQRQSATAPLRGISCKSFPATPLPIVPPPAGTLQISLARLTLVVQQLGLRARTESKGRVVLNRFFAPPFMHSMTTPTVFATPPALAFLAATQDESE